MLWNVDLLDFHRRAIQMRRSHPSLRIGSFETVYAAGGIYAFHRQSGDEDAIVVFNINKAPASVDLSLASSALDGRTFSGVWNGGRHEVTGDRLTGLKAPSCDALVLISQV